MVVNDNDDDGVYECGWDDDDDDDVKEDDDFDF